MADSSLLHNLLYATYYFRVHEFGSLVGEVGGVGEYLFSKFLLFSFDAKFILVFCCE